MALSKTEQRTIQNIVARLKEPRCGCAEPHPNHVQEAERQAPGYEGVSRLYLNTWIIGALECLLPGEGRDPQLAENLSRR